MAVSVEIKDAVAQIIVSRPETRNAMTFEMYQTFYETCETLDGNADVRVVIVRGGGGTFISGTDIREFTNVRTAEDALAYERRLDTVVGRLERMSKVTIALIEGHATGGGLSIALACDLRYATEDARFGIPIARTVGNCLSMASYARVIDAVGPARARELLLTARLLTAAEAYAIGLVTGIHPTGDLDRSVLEVATNISALAPLTLQVSKEAVRRILEHRRLVGGDDLILRAYISEDFREGVRAFLERRAPAWKGR